MDPKPAGENNPKPTAPAFSRLGKYSILRELGRGGMGVVYEALDEQLRRKVALKLMRADSLADSHETIQSEERFLREARLGANLQKHPHLVSVFEAGVIDDQRYIAMEFIDGRSVSEWRKAAAPSPRQQVSLLRDVALAIHLAHEQGVIHRDLKPQNILVDAKGRPHVTDLGLSKKVGADASLSLSAPGAIVGTPAYMSPEQAQGLKTIDRRTDIYALGVMLYETLAGRPPFTGDTLVEILMKIVKNPVPAPSSILKRTTPGMPDPALEGVCLKALAKRPADRYATAKDFADDLTRWLGGKEVRVTVPPARGARSEKKTFLGLLGTWGVNSSTAFLTSACA